MSDRDRDRRLSFLTRFWKGGKLTQSEMGELTRLCTENAARIWEATAANNEAK